MNEQVIFKIYIKRGKDGMDTFISAHTLKELNNFLSELEAGFIGGIEDSIFNKEIVKEEYISYINELGISVQGEVKDYIIKEEFLEYLLRLSLLQNKGLDKEIPLIDDFKMNNLIPFYKKILTVKRYFIEDIVFMVEAGMEIIPLRMDQDV